LTRNIPRKTGSLPLKIPIWYVEQRLGYAGVSDKERLTNFAQNGGYENPAPIKRQFRDPHGDWWDKQERRNYGEAVHEDHDQMGIFTPYEYTWTNPGKGLVMSAVAISVFLSVCWTVKATYPDKPSYPREFGGGLEKELGGSGAVRVS
jgi:NADH dehydrogenase (ubiquinone) 1 beta subcomplex subunit 8